MLQFDRHLAAGSKFVRGSHSKPPTNYLSRNKRAIRDKSRSLVAAASAEEKAKGRPRSKKASERQPPPRRKEEKRASANGGPARDSQAAIAVPGAGSDTVVISKSYLDDLLRMSVMRGDSERETKCAPVNKHTDSRVTVEPTQIPGLDLTSHHHSAHEPPPQPSSHAHQSTGHAQYQSTPLQAKSTVGKELSPQEKWLQDLAAQVEEQKAKKERSRLLEKQSTVEEYFPFGRPGGGAPIRSQSGHLLTDYRSRTRHPDQDGMASGHLGETNKTNVQVHHERQAHKTIYEDKVLSYRDQGLTDATRHGMPPSGYGGGAGNVMMSPRRNEPQATEIHGSTPRFARGAGPHVDQYMLQEMNEKRRKQMEHMEFIRQQVAEKERVKMEEKLRREREEAIEEAKLAMERERLKTDFEREKEKVRRKELEARQRQALLQQRIAEAELSAKQAKLEARGGMLLTNEAHHPTVSFDEDAVYKSYDSDYVGESVYGSLSKSELRSPSMLQLVNSSTTDGSRHGNSNAPPTHRGVANDTKRIGKKARPVEGERRGADRRENEREGVRRRNSRIPVMQPSPGPGSKSKIGGSSRSSNTKMERGSKATSRRPREGHKPAAMAVTGREVERRWSPPVPVVAKKLKQGKVVEGDQTYLIRKPPPRGDDDVAFVRCRSPPVPAVARKMKSGELQVTSLSEVVSPPYERAPSPPVPVVAKRLRDNELTSTTQALHERLASSPPVPTVAKRVRHQENRPPQPSYDRASSPPVPAVAKRLQQDKMRPDGAGGAKSNSAPVVPAAERGIRHVDRIAGSISDSEDKGQLSINRPPSCKPDSKPLSPVAMTTSTSLPAVAIATSNHCHDNQQLMGKPQSSNRQRLILQQLTMLKEGILTQQNNIDHRVQTILTRNKQCNF